MPILGIACIRLSKSLENLSQSARTSHSSAVEPLRSAGCVCRRKVGRCNNLRTPCQPSQASQDVSVETLTLTIFDAHRIPLHLLVWHGAKLTNMLSLRRNLTHEAYLR